MKYSRYLIQHNANSRTVAFFNRSTQSPQHVLNICPENVGANWLVKNLLQRFVMFGLHAMPIYITQNTKSQLSPQCIFRREGMRSK